MYALYCHRWCFSLRNMSSWNVFFRTSSFYIKEMMISWWRNDITSGTECISWDEFGNKYVIVDNYRLLQGNLKVSETSRAIKELPECLPRPSQRTANLHRLLRCKITCKSSYNLEIVSFPCWKFCRPTTSYGPNNHLTVKVDFMAWCKHFPLLPWGNEEKQDGPLSV
jgi:hypothetical protein